MEEEQQQAVSGPLSHMMRRDELFLLREFRQQAVFLRGSPCICVCSF